MVARSKSPWLKINLLQKRQSSSTSERARYQVSYRGASRWMRLIKSAKKNDQRMKKKKKKKRPQDELRDSQISRETFKENG